jgi:hypothetical protein
MGCGWGTKLALVALVAIIAGCGGDGRESDATGTGTAVPSEPAGIAPAQRITGSYSLNGRERKVLIVRFTARDRSGEHLAEAFRLTPAKLSPGDPRSPRRLSVGFMVRRGERLTTLEMHPTVDALRGRLHWQLGSRS